MEDRRPDAQEIEGHDGEVAGVGGGLVIPEIADAVDGGLKGHVAGIEQAHGGIVFEDLQMGDLIDEVEAPFVEGGDVEEDEKEEDDGGPALEGVADVAAVVVLHGVVLDAEPGDINAVEDVKEEGREDGGDFDEGKGGFEVVNLVHIC